MSAGDLHFDMGKEWPMHEKKFHVMAAAFPGRMVIFYKAMSVLGVKVVRDSLMDKVYSQPLPQSASFGRDPSPRTGRTLLAVAGSSNGFTSRVFIDRRKFPLYFYPYILEHGRQASPAYYARYYFRDAMRKLEVLYFREARFFLKQFMFERGFM